MTDAIETLRSYLDNPVRFDSTPNARYALIRLEALVRAAEDATSGLASAVANAPTGALRRKFEEQYETLDAALRAVKGEQT